MLSSIVWMILGMAAVTYIPRMIPLVAFQSFKLPAFLQKVLKNVPYAILGALIIPGVFLIHEEIMYGVAGALIAVIFSYLGANVIVVVIGTIVALAGLSYLFF
ncbi:AzlD domain-containing protein [Bacillus gobiensis]|uniref:AzlD domain-containing protein n=1 Tax=Bacillus gobiensis TaxID=1441095 RepID=UPI003D21DB7C